VVPLYKKKGAVWFISFSISAISSNLGVRIISSVFAFPSAVALLVNGENPLLPAAVKFCLLMLYFHLK
jgi:hypothetical protein